jgi:cytochrome c biogenesis protein CcmG/thiol:disulfide interchange protein DsbE
MTRTRSRLPYLLSGVAALVVVFFAWLVRDWLETQSVRPGSRAPVFQATTMEGTPASLADFADQVVLLNIWATWCAPCRVEMPSMERLYQELKDEGLEIVAVSVDAPLGQRDAVGNPGGDIQAFADSLSLTFPILHDPEGRIQRLYQSTGVPESFIVGRDGLIYRKLIGPTEWDRPEYLDFFRRLLNGEG